MSLVTVSVRVRGDDAAAARAAFDAIRAAGAVVSVGGFGPAHRRTFVDGYFSITVDTDRIQADDDPADGTAEVITVEAEVVRPRPRRPRVDGGRRAIEGEGR